MASFVKIEKQGRVALVHICRPEAKNALSVAVMRELDEAARVLREDMGASVVVLSGGPEFFTAGVDLKDPELLRVLGEPLAVRRRVLESGPLLCRAWEELPQITIAAVEGHCIGGGVALTAALDFRVCGEGAFFRVPEIERGMNFSWGTLPRLSALIGPAETKRWVILAETVDVERAERAGFVQWRAPKGGAEAMAIEIAEKIAAKPAASVMMTKRTVNALYESGRSLSHMDADQFALTVLSEDFQEGVAAFLEKREPKFNQSLPD